MTHKARFVLSLVVAALLMGGILAGGSALGDMEERQQQEIRVFKRDRAAEPQDEEEVRRRPGLAAEEILRVSRSEAQARRDEAIRILRDLIRDTPQDDPQRPDLLFRLSEMMWERATHFRMRAYSYDPEIWATEKKDPARHAQLMRMQQEDLERARKYRMDTLQVYEHIHERHPDYEKMDQVLFFMGFNYSEIGENRKAQLYLRDLITRFPNSQYIPDAYLAFGEFFFGIDEIENALIFYRRAADSGEPRVYGFALYKQAWCYMNLGRHQEAMQKLLEVIEYSSAPEASGDAARLSLRQEAIKDIVVPYSHVGRGDRALDFFRQIAPEDYVAMSERLARLYSGQGSLDEANALYRELIRERMDSPDVINYEYQIVLNVERMGNREDTMQEAVRLATLFRMLVENGVLRGRELESSGTQVQSLLREYATTWHREAEVTKNPVYYRHSAEMYRQLLQTFPDGEDIYLMTFYFGELLFSTENWEEAAEVYERVLSMDREGEFAREAVHALVLCYRQLLEMETAPRRSEDLITIRVGTETTEPDAAPTFEKKEISSRHRDFMRAARDYLDLWPDGPNVVDLKYAMAMIYYEHYHFDEAIEGFLGIVDNHPENELAVFSAHLTLDSYNALQDYAAMDAMVRKFLAVGPLAQGRLLEVLQSIQEESSFRASMELEEKREYQEAAEAYMAFAMEFSDSDLLDKALFNAALNFDRVNQVEMAIRARSMLIQYTPESDLVPRAFFAIGGNFQAIATFSESARAFEAFVEAYPDDENAPIALNNAAVFRQGLEEYDRAIANFRKYVELYGRKHPDRASLVFFEWGTIYERQDNWATVISHYEEFIRRWARHQGKSATVQAWNKIGLAHSELGSRRDAETSFNKAVEEFNSIGKDETEELLKGREAAAQATYGLGEFLFADYVAIRLDDPRKLQEQIQEKQSRLVEAQKVYGQVAAYMHPNWTIAALGRIGEGYVELAEAIRQAPPPPGMDEEALYVYQDLLEQEAFRFDQIAVEVFRECLAEAHKSRWFNEYTVYAEKHLHRLAPTEFSMDRELRAQPIFMGEGFRSSPFVISLEGDDDDHSDDAPEQEPRSGEQA